MTLVHRISAIGIAMVSLGCQRRQHSVDAFGQICVVWYRKLGIVQKVFSEKASAIARMRQKCVRNASKMRQKCVKMGLVLLGKEERSKMRQK